MMQQSKEIGKLVALMSTAMLSALLVVGWLAYTHSSPSVPIERVLVAPKILKKFEVSIALLTLREGRVVEKRTMTQEEYAALFKTIAKKKSVESHNEAFCGELRVVRIAFPEGVQEIEFGAEGLCRVMGPDGFLYFRGVL